MQAKGISWRYINKSYIPNVELKKKSRIQNSTFNVIIYFKFKKRQK